MEHSMQYSKPKIFADDTNIFLFDKDLNTLYKKTNNELSNLQNWLLANKLTLSIGHNKDTKYTLFSYHNIKNSYILPNLLIMNENVPIAKSVKYLGVIVDEKLNFCEHINAIQSKINSYVGLFYKIRYKLTTELLRQLYFSFIYSHIYYCAEIYGNGASQKCIEKLQLIQNKSLRALQFKNKYFPINKLHSNFNILKVQDLILFKQMSLLHSIKYTPASLPNPTLELLPITDHQYPTRNKSHFEICPTHSKFGKKMLKSKCSKFWYSLPSIITESMGKNYFKNKFYNHFLKSYSTNNLNFPNA